MSDLSGKTIVITGASSGIGAAAALRLAERGATIVPVGRSPQRTKEIAARLGVEPLIADFGDLDQVRELAARLLERCQRIDVLANNAGALVSTRQVTADGHELTFQANHLAPFLLTTLLLPRLKDSAPARVITTASLGNRFGTVRLDDLEWQQRRYGRGWRAYSTSKLMNILFTRELARRTAGTGVDAVCFHPRSVSGEKGSPQPIRFGGGSALVRAATSTRILRWATLQASDGAGPLVWLAGTPALVSGAYYNGITPGARVNQQADDPALAAELWTRTQAIVSAPVR
jgi:NAD(P)-dependent dehydrogenase (short-subunit alcohol dehydrogenase family)